MYLHISTAALLAAGNPTIAIPGHVATTPVTAPTVSVSTDTIEDLLRMLRELFIRLGADPGVLSDQAPPEVWYTTITEYYTLHGVPQGLTPSEQASFRTLVAQTYASVSACTSIVGLAPTLLFKVTLKSMYADLGGNPADLG